MKNIVTALINFQKKVPNIPKNCTNPFFSQCGKKAMYADLATVIGTCMPTLNLNDLAVIQAMGIHEGKNILTTRLVHSSGEEITGTIFLPDIQDAQKLTAAITYLRRTSYLSILGLVADDDQDGNELYPEKNPSRKPQEALNHPAPQRQGRSNPSFSLNSSPSDAPASPAQIALVKRLAPDVDTTGLTKSNASKLIEQINKGSK